MIVVWKETKGHWNLKYGTVELQRFIDALFEYGQSWVRI